MSVSNKKIKELRKILETENFYSFLCSISNNDINQVTTNLAKIINYVLSTEEELNLDFKTIIKNGLNYNKQGKYQIYSTNSYLDSLISFSGIKPSMSYSGINKDLTFLNHELSFLTYDTSPYFPVYTDIKKAIEEGFSNPKSLYKSILKQPQGKERPLIVGESEEAYYSSILQRRLQNIPNEYANTGAKLAKKVLKEIIGKDVTLYFLPDSSEIGKEIDENISPFSLRKITIPSRYTLMTMCARNKRLREGSKISIIDGEEYKKEKPLTETYSSLKYYRYERIPITEKFEYNNEELSGDLSYDLDDLYGKDDTKDNREMLRNSSLSRNLERIQRSHDINLSLRNGKYRITNGRHRILYLKNYYISNYKDYKNEVLLNKLKEMVSIVASVERTIEDPEINSYLITLEKYFPNIKYLKTNIQDDNFSIIIILENNAYLIESREELKEFFYLISKGKDNNKYFIGLNSNLEFIPSEVILAKVITEISEDIIDLDFYDIIYYLQNNNIIINNEELDFSKINFNSLYSAYMSIIHTLELSKLNNIPYDIVAKSNLILENYENKNQRKR